MKAGWGILTTILLAAFAALADGSNAKAADTSTATQIKIDNFSFAPQTITVPVGAQVTWTNQDDIPHTVVSDDKTTFKSKALDTDEKFSVTFTKAGTYSYFCSIHPKMTAKLVVQ